jgi:hypothetical protein
MNKTDSPEAYGVFKPVGQVLVAFPTDSDLRGARDELLRAGFAEGDVTTYAPEQMVRQADHDLQDAGVLASIGQELNLVKAHRELALQGHGFLLVRAPRDEDAQRVAEIARRFNAARAQRYGRMMIEELIEVGSGEKQVAESPDRGLDAQTRSGHEVRPGR